MAKKPHPESDDKGAESAGTDSALPMERFKKLARKLVDVSKKDLSEEMERQEARKKK